MSQEQEFGINPHDLVYVYQVEPENRQLRYQLAGKVAILDDGVHVLSDYFGLLGGFPEGAFTERTVGALRSLRDSPYTMIETLGQKTQREKELEQQEQPDIDTPTGDTEGAFPNIELSRKRPPVFQYHRAGMERPHTLELVNGKLLLDGSQLEEDEALKILSNVHSGVATLKRSELDEMSLQKGRLDDLRSRWDRLKKMPGALQLVWRGGVGGDLRPGAAIDEAVRKGIVESDMGEKLRRYIYEDDMIPGMGNKRAYLEFTEDAPPRPDYKFLMLDANDFKQINDVLGHQHGDAAIKALGGAILKAKDRTLGDQDTYAKAHRYGGDEFAVYLPEQEVPRFLRHLRGELETIPPLGGRLNLSMSVGAGYSEAEADVALNVGAKGQKQHAVARLGGDPTDRSSPIRAPDPLYAYSYTKGPLTVQEGQQLPSDIDWDDMRLAAQNKLTELRTPPTT